MLNCQVNPHAVTLIFGLGTHPWITPLIKIRTRSKFSHVAYVDPLSGLIIEAAGGKGVRVISFDDFIAKYPHWHTATMFVPCVQYTRQFMIEQIGKPYDHKAFWAYVFAQNWEDPKAWTCTEVIAAASGMHRGRTFSRITPHDLYSVTRPHRFEFERYDFNRILTREERWASDPSIGTEQTILNAKTKLTELALKRNWDTSLTKPVFKPIIYA